MDRSRIVVALALAFSLIAVIVGIASIGISSRNSRFVNTTETFFTSGRAGIALIEINGVIQDSGGGSGRASADRIVQQIKDAKDAPNIRAVLLSINSPGGSVGATKRIYDAVFDFRKKKHVVAVVSDVAASGGYYIASAAEKIFAYEGSIIGSIGVISFHPDISDFLQRYGIRFNAIKAGRYKDSSYPFRAMTDEEVKMHEDMIQDAYHMFLVDVANGRGQPFTVIQKDWAEGRIFSGAQAKKINMIDDFGGREKGIDAIKELIGTEEDLPIFQPEKNFWEQILEDSPIFSRSASSDILLSPALFLYPSGGSVMEYFRPMIGQGVEGAR